MKISIDGLEEAIIAQLEDWKENTVKRAANETFEELAAMAAGELKQGGPYAKRTGKYAKDWTYDQRTSKAATIAGVKSYSVYNKKHYQLVHLLEKGHQSRNGGRVRAFEHVRPVNDTLGELAVQKILQKVEG